VTRQVCIIGLDGATWAVLDKYMAQGWLPNIKKLVETGARAVMTSTIPPITPVAWSSMTTGTNPGEHGILSFGGMERREGGKVKFVPSNAAVIRRPPLWRLLSDAGRRVCVVNVPVTYPPVPVNGCIISGMDTPDSAAEYTYPAGLKAELAAAGIDYQIDFDVSRDAAGRYSLELALERISGEATWFFERAATVTRERLKAIKFLLERPWDFFMCVFVGMDRVQHMFWDYLFAETLPDEPHAETVHRRIREYYHQLDDAVGQIAETAGPEAVVALVSDHGFRKAGYGDFFVNTWLRDHGWLTLKTRSLRRALGLLARRIGVTRVKLGKLVGDAAAGKLSASAVGIDWKKTRAYYARTWGVCLNVAGREPYGIVQPGQEFDELRNRLAEELIKAVDPLGRKVFRAVHRYEELFRGPYADGVGDLIVEPAEECPYTFFSKETLPPGTRRPIDRTQQGTHDLNGIFLLRGPGIKPATASPNCSIMDVAPTVLHLMGEPIPEHMEGRVAEPMLESPPATQAATAGRPSTPAPAEKTSDFTYTEQERAAVEERLRHLGYLD